MSFELDHLKANSRRIESERAAFNAHVEAVNNSINDAAANLASTEDEFPGENGKALPFRERLRKLKQERAGIKRPAIYDPLPEVERWLALHPKTPPADPVKADIRKGETALMAHNRVATGTALALKSIAGIEQAPPPIEDLKASLKSQIAELAARPQIVKGRLMLPKTALQVGASAVVVDNAPGLMAWAIGDYLLAAAESLLIDDPTAMTDADRKAALDKAYGGLLAALRQEAACAMQAEIDGQRVERRRNVHPAILLNLKIDGATAYRYLRGAP